jgi:hypothetical protein
MARARQHARPSHKHCKPCANQTFKEQTGNPATTLSTDNPTSDRRISKSRTKMLATKMLQTEAGFEAKL